MHTINSNSSLKVIQGGDKRATKTAQMVRLGTSAEANTVALIKWNWNKPHAKNLRTGRVSLPNQAYLVTAVTASRQPVFSTFTAARLAVRCFHDRNVVRRAQTLAFVVMPDHIHWLLQLAEEGGLSEAVRAYKTKVSLLLRQRIWQHGFHDHALRDDENLHGVARYIVANPLRAGLVNTIGDYPHWDAIWLP